MVLITKQEKHEIRQRFPKVWITRTMKQRSKRHRYYCEEAPAVMRFLDRLRGKGLRNAARASA